MAKRRAKKKKVVRNKKREAVIQKKNNLPWSLIFGIILLLLGAYLKTQLSNPLPIAPSVISKVYNKQVDYSKLPNFIEIPKLKLTLAVEQTIIENGKWGISPNTASHLLLSAVPRGEGNIIIYGHNKPGQLKDLGKIVLGDYIKLKTVEGKEYLYRITAKDVVWPNQIEFLKPTTKETLTLYTCTGFADSQRLVVRAVPALDSFDTTSIK